MASRRLTITRDMPPPLLVAEVVSPGRTSRDRDFINKRAQYAAIGVLEYWILDPIPKTVLVLKLDGEEYQEIGQFQGEERIPATTFPALTLTGSQIFRA